MRWDGTPAGPGPGALVATPSACPGLWPKCTPVVAQGMSLAEALVAFAHVGRRPFSHDDKCFFLENAVLGPVADRISLLHGAERRVVRGCEGEADMTLFLVGGVIAAGV